MIKRVAFKIDDVVGMNQILKTCDMVPQAGSFINEGWVNFAVDDGEQDTVANMILDHKKVLRNDLNLLEATKFNLRTINYDIAELEAHMAKKEVIEKKKDWEDALKQMEQIKAALLLTEKEIYRLEKEVAVRRERIKELETEQD